MKNSQPVVFLDRDGTLIHEQHYLSDLEQIVFFTDVARGLKRLKDSGFILILISNQSGVGRGYFNEDFVDQAFQKMNQILSKNDVQLDGHYFCPHHPVHANPPYLVKCNCRKPLPGMIIKAQDDLNIDISKSFMIGDKHCDIELAQNCSLQGILLKTGYGLKEKDLVRKDFPQMSIADCFADAVDLICRQDKRIKKTPIPCRD